MTFLWPEALGSALVVPALLLLYVQRERRRRQTAALYPGLFAAASDPERDQQRSMRRHAPLMLFVVSLCLLSIALARPTASLPALSRQGTIILVLDASHSMSTQSASSSPLAQMRTTAKQLVDEHSGRFSIGLIVFGAHAATVLDPTPHRNELYSAIDNIAPRQGTAIGIAIATALSMIFPDIGIDPDGLAFGFKSAIPNRTKNKMKHEGTPVQSVPGSYDAAAIVLLSDGQSNTGPDPMEAARLAADLGVRVHTIGLGDPIGKIVRIDGWSMRVKLEEVVLKRISAVTGGRYNLASEPIDWKAITSTIRPESKKHVARTEITALFAAAGGIAALLSTILSLYRSRRIL